jgi:hypothetical protein
MAQEWLERRHKDYQEKLQKQLIQEQYLHNAIQSFPGMFENLKHQISTDVRDYNEIFRHDQHCRATIDPTVDGVRIEVQNKSVRVRKTVGSTVIALEYIGTERNQDSLELVPDAEGSLRFKSNRKDDLLNLEQASEYVLDLVLCK